jgi:hypothetical protein
MLEIAMRAADVQEYIGQAEKSARIKLDAGCDRLARGRAFHHHHAHGKAHNMPCTDQ